MSVNPGKTQPAPVPTPSPREQTLWRQAQQLLRGGLPRNVRGPDRVQRVRRTWTDTAVGAPNPNSWLDFNVGRSIRLLRTDRESAIRLVLKKLHIRWWRASELTMKRFLEKVGVSQITIDNIPNVVQSCPVCREWAKPGPANVSSASAPRQVQPAGGSRPRRVQSSRS